jgi:hypothetical protein
MFRFCGKLMDEVREEATANGGQQVASKEVESDSDKWPGKDHMIATISDLKKQIEKMTHEKEESLAAAERKKLEDEQNWKGLADRAEKERDELKVGYEKQLREMRIRVGLAGLDDLSVDGAIFRCPVDADVDKYVNEIREKYADKFAVVEADGSKRVVSQGLRGSKGNNGLSLEDRLKYDDPKNPEESKRIRQAARAEKAKAGGYD